MQYGIRNNEAVLAVVFVSGFHTVLLCVEFLAFRLECNNATYPALFMEDVRNTRFVR